MTGTEQKIFKLISKTKKISFFEIARELGISTDYTRLICKSLKRRGFINISGNYCYVFKKDQPVQKVSVSPQVEPRTPKKKRVIKKKRVPKRKKETHSPSTLTCLKNVNRKIAKILRDNGYKSIENIANSPFVKFMQATGLNLGEAARIHNQAKKRAGKLNINKL